MSPNDIDRLKGYLKDYLFRQGINTNNAFRCLSPDHDDKHPSMSYDPKRNKVKCFSCGVDWDIIDIVKNTCNLSYTEALDEVGKMFGICDIPNTTKKSNASNQNDLSNFFKTAHENITETDYMERRGISLDLINRFNIGFCEKFNGTSGDWSAVIIPTGENSYCARNTDPNANKENRYKKQGPAQLFNSEALRQKRPIFIVEGEIEALSVIVAGGEAVALGSCKYYRKLIDYIKSNGIKPTVIIALDGDNAGTDAVERLTNELNKLNIKNISVHLGENGGDANDLLITNRAKLVKKIAEAEEAITKTALGEDLEINGGQYFDIFKKNIKEQANTPYFHTGFEHLDNILDGGLYDGLYFIGAISSLGKTTFCLQIADQIAKTKQDVLIFSLEMSIDELIAKSISRETMLAVYAKHDYRLAKTVRNITNYKRYEHYSQEEKEAINNAMNNYSKYAQYLFFVEGVGEVGTNKIREVIEKHLNRTGNRPIVIIDYVQIISPSNELASDKRNTDTAVLELKRISRDFKIPILCISSFNRDNYNNKVSMQAFKESGAIEYSSDVLIGLQFQGQGSSGFNLEEAKAKGNTNDTINPINNYRDVELFILKNRNGITGKSIRFKYWSAFNFFVENPF